MNTSEGDAFNAPVISEFRADDRTVGGRFDAKQAEIMPMFATNQAGTKPVIPVVALSRA